MFRTFLLMMVIVGCTPKAPVPQDWQDWVKDLKERYSEQFSVPSIVHHIYLSKVGDSAWIKEGPQGLRWSKSCDDCLYKVILKKGLSTELAKKNGETTLLEAKKQNPVDKEGRIFLTPYVQEGANQVRIFIHDLKLNDLDKKRDRKFYDYNPKVKMDAEFEWLEEPKSFTMNRSDGSTKEMKVVAQLKYRKDGEPGVLSIYDYGSSDEKYKDEQKLMLLYRDYTNGKKTYGAGRFLIVDLKKPLKEMINNDKVIVDLNYSYNPPCAVSTGFHCPLPQDMMKQEVAAGEQYTKSK